MFPGKREPLVEEGNYLSNTICRWFADVTGHEDGFLLKAAEGITGIDAFAEILGQKRADAVSLFVLADMHALMDQRVAIVAM